jgi:predicted short-subunit dehydrogenase-like oxidoreductase (DUF2520 family)
VPLIALTALGIDPGMRLVLPRQALRRLNAGKRRLYEALAASVSRGDHRVLEDARHSSITTDCPDAVTPAVHDVWQRVC